MKNKSEKGITMVALAITIIIMLILAGVSLNAAFGNKNNPGIISTVRNSMTNEQEIENVENDKRNAIITDLEDEWGI